MVIHHLKEKMRVNVLLFVPLGFYIAALAHWISLVVQGYVGDKESLNL